MTTKKKRIPRPKKTEEISLLLNTLPLIEDDPALLSEGEIFKYAKQVCRLGGTEKNFDVDEREFSIKYGQGIRQALCMTRFILREVIFFGLSTPSKQTEIQDAEKWLTTSEQLGSSHTYGIQPGYINQWSGEKWNSWAYPVETVSYLLSVALIHSFRRDVIRGKPKDGPGKFYIGICPRCKKIFERKTNRQMWCGDSCRGNQNTPIKKQHT